jgi:hypothetical protein
MTTSDAGQTGSPTWAPLLRPTSRDLEPVLAALQGFDALDDTVAVTRRRTPSPTDLAAADWLRSDRDSRSKSIADLLLHGVIQLGRPVTIESLAGTLVGRPVWAFGRACHSLFAGGDPRHAIDESGAETLGRELVAAAYWAVTGPAKHSTDRVVVAWTSPQLGQEIQFVVLRGPAPRRCVSISIGLLVPGIRADQLGSWIDELVPWWDCMFEHHPEGLMDVVRLDLVCDPNDD